MAAVFGTYRDGQILFDVEASWENGTRVVIAPMATDAHVWDVANGRAPLSEEEFDQLIDEACDIVDAAAGADRVPLSDYAVSRAGIYEDHP